MIYFIVAVLTVSLMAYVIFAGADFGAGIYELLHVVSARRDRKHLIEGAIGPIWEANHIWLILAVVIFFMGFPQAFYVFSVMFHIPMTAVLVGITLRGTAFAFRHYDPIEDHWQKKYTLLFGLSSVWTAFWQGLIVGALFKLLPVDPARFVDYFVSPWLSPFTVAVGVFVVSIYLLLAHTFLLSEEATRVGKHSHLFDEIWRSLAFAVAAGSVVLLTGLNEDIALVDQLLTSPFAVGALVLATILLGPLVLAYHRRRSTLARALVTLQVSLIFGVVLVERFPTILRFSDGSAVNLLETAAPQATLDQLGYALIGGSCLIFPFLLFLFRVFKADASAAKDARDP